MLFVEWYEKHLDEIVQLVKSQVLTILKNRYGDNFNFKVIEADESFLEFLKSLSFSIHIELITLGAVGLPEKERKAFIKESLKLINSMSEKRILNYMKLIDK